MSDRTLLIMDKRQEFNLSNRTYRPYLMIAVSIVLLLILSACGGEEEPDAPVVLDEIVAATPTIPPTPTTVPTAAPTRTPTPTPEPAEAVIGEDGTVVETENGTVVTGQQIIEPQVVSINFRNGIINDWIEVVPPPGWILSEGVDGIILSKDPSQLPDASFALVRRWGNAVNTGDWVAYLPDGFEERDSNVTIRMGGFDWDGIFVTNTSNTYRAFFAVNNDSIPAFTVLVYVPYPEERIIPSQPVTREEMALYYEEEVGDLNTILRRFLFP